MDLYDLKLFGLIGVSGLGISGAIFAGPNAMVIQRDTAGNPPSIEGVVQEEFGRVHQIVSGNAENRFPSGNLEYSIKVQGNDGRVYFLEVINTASKPNIALAQAIGPGTEVKIESGITLADYLRGPRVKISKDGIGSAYSDKVQLK